MMTESEPDPVLVNEGEKADLSQKSNDELVSVLAYLYNYGHTSADLDLAKRINDEREARGLL